MGGDGLVVLGSQGVQMAGELSQGGFSIAHAQIARLLQRGQGVIDAGDGLFIGVDVEVADGVVDELEG
jgi:hypothetical protein